MATASDTRPRRGLRSRTSASTSGTVTRWLPRWLVRHVRRQLDRYRRGGREGLLWALRMTSAAVAAYLHERDGDLATAARLYAEAARKAANVAERNHLTRQAARLNARRSL